MTTPDATSAPDHAATDADDRVHGVKPAGQYHHGDLRHALIHWGTHLLDTQGIEAFTLRAAAKAAGVSPAAPSRHFGDKHGLLAAIAAQGFRDLVRIRVKRLDGVARDDAKARLHAVMSGYVEFATRYPARFQLMFGPHLARNEHEDLGQAAEASFNVMRSVVVPLIQTPRTDGLSDDDLAFAVWASAHGLAMLRVNRQRLPRGTPELDSDHLTSLLVGFVLSALQPR